MLTLAKRALDKTQLCYSSSWNHISLGFFTASSNGDWDLFPTAVNLLKTSQPWKHFPTEFSRLGPDNYHSPACVLHHQSDHHPYCLLLMYLHCNPGAEDAQQAHCGKLTCIHKSILVLDTHTRKEGQYGQLLFAFCYGRIVGQDAGLHVTLPGCSCSVLNPLKPQENFMQ